MYIIPATNYHSGRNQATWERSNSLPDVRLTARDIIVTARYEITTDIMLRALLI